MNWDVDFHKRLQHGESRFDLQVRFRSEVSRLVLFGPSGAGKSLTLKVMAGILRPDGGRVQIAGQTLFDSASGVNRSAQQRRLAYVFQDYALFPHLTLQQNIAFALRTGWVNPPRGPGDASVQRWIETFQLQPVAGHYPHQISGGQRQRTALARALVNDPCALLLDEPFAALDRGLRQQLREELSELQARLRIPMLVITHDDDDVAFLAEHVVQLRGGRVVTDSQALA